MPTFLQKLFRKKSPPAPVVAAPAPILVAPVAASPSRVKSETSMTVPQVAVARLSLLPILQKLPDELRQNILRFPEAEATVALPLSTIQKQLAAGSVKMSLASLYRQAPAGTFNQMKVEEKRMVEVPLSEVLRHVQPDALRRRADQRRLDLPRSAPQLFGDRSNPFAIAPSTEEDFPEPDLTPKFTLDDEDANGFDLTSKAAFPAPSPTLGARLRMGERPSAAPSPTPAAAPPPEVEGNVSLPVSQVCADWPESLRAEADSVPDARLEIPARLLAASLTQGKVVFGWRQLRTWFVPALSGTPAELDALEVTLPLKVVAPAFLAHSRPSGQRREVDLDETIPALFNGGEVATAEPAQMLPEVALPEVTMEGLPVEKSNGHAMAFRLAEDEAPVAATPPLTFKLAEEPPETVSIPEPLLHEEAILPVAHVDSSSSTVIAAPRPAASRSTTGALGTIFGKSDKQQWSPQELIDGITSLPGVAGAIVALREGLVVASKLPDHMKGDTVAAFLPQIFARLNNYSSEMQMGEVQDVLLTTNGAHFQGYCLGEIYFAVLGIAGEALPWEALRLVLQELQAQTPQ